MSYAGDSKDEKTGLQYLSEGYVLDLNSGQWVPPEAQAAIRAARPLESAAAPPQSQPPFANLVPTDAPPTSSARSVSTPRILVPSTARRLDFNDQSLQQIQEDIKDLRDGVGLLSQAALQQTRQQEGTLPTEVVVNELQVSLGETQSQIQQNTATLGRISAAVGQLAAGAAGVGQLAAGAAGVAAVQNQNRPRDIANNVLLTAQVVTAVTVLAPVARDVTVSTLSTVRDATSSTLQATARVPSILNDAAVSLYNTIQDRWFSEGSPMPPESPYAQVQSPRYIIDEESQAQLARVPDGGPPSDPLPDGGGDPKKDNQGSSGWWTFLKWALGLIFLLALAVPGFIYEFVSVVKDAVKSAGEGIAAMFGGLLACLQDY
jgi:hypothetical protein